MATTRTSKIRVRQGNFSDLPVLDPGEIGYAKDSRRLFIGNDVVNVGTGNGVLLGFTLPLSVSKPNITTVFVAGSAVNASTYSITGTTLLFASAPTGVITVGFNSEIDIVSDVTLPSSISLAANGSNADTGFQIDTTNYNIVVMDYTLESTNGVRIGQLRFGTDISASTSTIADNYTETAAVGITFSVDIASANTMKLMYTDADNLITKFKYTYQLWNSN
tara:strand:+ start:499 stop:1158 length:660 start_codon:yes stop_codon:yes gene_type:complete